MKYLILVFLCCISIASCIPTLQVEFGDDLSSVIASRLEQLIKQAAQSNYKVSRSNNPISSLPLDSLVLSFGNTSTTHGLISSLSELNPEGFIVRSSSVVNAEGGHVTVYACNGLPPLRRIVDVYSPDETLPNTGLNYASYALLESIGFGFFHPLQPLIPSQFIISSNVNVVERGPKWPFRAWHYHTEHPLELTNFLNGWGRTSPDDEQGWNLMLPEWNLFLEWLVANRQNMIQFILLAADEWKDFVSSPTRQARLAQITNAGQAWGVAVGADLPIATIQQHAWYIVDPFSNMTEQIKQIHQRIDWLVQAGFDFLSTESGFSEFTHPDCKVMLTWMNETTNYMKQQYGRRTFIKAHISTGQVCTEFNDPVTGKPPCNFNYLPHYATPDLGVCPHTVQLYTFDDPAPTYGQQNFSGMFKYMMVEAPERTTLYHGETAYWVNYDIDVPLFLPLYASARVYDLRKTARAEQMQRVSIGGQLNFESGWEWAYWLSNLITARAAWNPQESQASHDDAMRRSFEHVTRLFGKAGPALNEWLVSYSNLQHDLLVLGKVNQTIPPSVEYRNGIAYLEGWDTWAQLMPIVGIGTQPLNLDISKMGFSGGQDFYTSAVEPLLTEMDSKFYASFNQLLSLQSLVPAEAWPFFDDILDSTEMTYLRAHFVHAIYDSMWQKQPSSWRSQRLKDAMETIEIAQKVVLRRESAYRVPLDRVAGWGRNDSPTSYDSGFLWTVHSLYFYWRDLYRAMDQLTSFNPCFLNIIDPVRVAFGDGPIQDLEEKIAEYLRQHGLSSIAECLSAPAKEPSYTFPK